jgi:hypothetical protein
MYSDKYSNMDTHDRDQDLRKRVLYILRSVSEVTHEDPYCSHLLMTVGNVNDILDPGISRIMVSPEKVYMRMGFDPESDDLPDLNVYDDGLIELLIRGIDKRIGEGDLDGTLVAGKFEGKKGVVIPGSYLIDTNTADPDLVAEEGVGRTVMRRVSKMVPGASGFMMSDSGAVREFKDGNIYNEIGYENGKQVILRKNGRERSVIPVTRSTRIEPGDQVIPVAAISA